MSDPTAVNHFYDSQCNHRGGARGVASTWAGSTPSFSYFPVQLRLLAEENKKEQRNPYRTSERNEWRLKESAPTGCIHYFFSSLPPTPLRRRAYRTADRTIVFKEMGEETNDPGLSTNFLTNPFGRRRDIGKASRTARIATRPS